jgi:anti-sigma factor RsiW
MNRHLDSEALCNWAAGEHSAEVESHLRECAACAGAVAQLESGLAEFRGSAQQWSDRRLPSRPPIPGPWRPAALGRRRAIFGAAGVAACTAVAVLLVAVPIQQRHDAAVRAAQQARADQLLLEQVNAAVSRSAPAPMEPLWKLVMTTGENQ